ncbi:RNA polymerase sigma factor [Planctomycetota bacterium]
MSETKKTQRGNFIVKDRDDFRSLFRAYASRIYGQVFRYCHDEHLAQEVVQDVFEGVLRMIQRGEVLEKPEHYLFRAARNRALYLKFRWKKAGSLPEDWNLAVVPKSALEDEEEQRMIFKALSQLELKYRQVICHRIYDNLTFETIASVLQEPLGTVTGHYRTGIEKLRIALKGYYS